MTVWRPEPITSQAVGPQCSQEPGRPCFSKPVLEKHPIALSGGRAAGDATPHKGAEAGTKSLGALEQRSQHSLDVAGAVGTETRLHATIDRAALKQLVGEVSRSGAACKLDKLVAELSSLSARGRRYLYICSGPERTAGGLDTVIAALGGTVRMVDKVNRVYLDDLAEELEADPAQEEFDQ